VVLSHVPRTHEKCVVGPHVAPEGLALKPSAALPPGTGTQRPEVVYERGSGSPASCPWGCAALSSQRAKDDGTPSGMLKPEPSRDRSVG